jgi:hypothetical protein
VDEHLRRCRGNEAEGCLGGTGPSESSTKFMGTSCAAHRVELFTKVARLLSNNILVSRVFVDELKFYQASAASKSSPLKLDPGL